MINGLDLFSGIGGLTLALRQWVKPIAYCERDPYCQAVLLQRMADRSIPEAPIWDDVSTFRSGDCLGDDRNTDIIYGGFPCQDISVAGTGTGLEGKRSGLYFEIERLVDELRPTYVFLENVPAIRKRGSARIISGLSRLGYVCRWTTVTAAEVGAPHIRKRWFLLAHSNRKGLERQLQPWGIPKKLSSPDRSGWWSTEPSVGRVANGVPARVDRIKGLGNAVVPLQAKVAFERLMGLEKEKK